MMGEGGVQPGRGYGGSSLGVVVEKMFWTPQRLRWDAEKSNELSWGLCFLYAAVGPFLTKRY